MEANGDASRRPAQRAYSLPQRVKRAVYRRLPGLQIAVNFLRAKTAHYLRVALQRVRLRRIRATWRWLVELGTALGAMRREKRLTVAVDVAAFWEPLTGIGWYLCKLLEHLADRDDLRVRLYGPSVIPSPDLPAEVAPIPRGPALERVLHPIPADLVIPRGLLIPLFRRLEPVLIALHGNRVLFAPNYFLPRRFLLARGSRVATVHDLGLRKVPWTLRPETLDELTGKLEHALFEADRLISVSATVRDELHELRYAAPERVRPIHHGPGHLAEVAAGEPPPEVPERYGLHVGTLEPRKNIVGLLDAWSILRRRMPTAPPLVLCGRFGWKADEIRARVERAADEGWLLHLGYVAEDQLAALYRRAAVVVFPSLYEGFGLPAVEAQWAGAPLVCSDIPALREVAGHGALYAPPDRPSQLAERIHEVLDDPDLGRRLVAQGRDRAAALSWERAAEATVEVWRQAAGEPQPTTYRGPA